MYFNLVLLQIQSFAATVGASGIVPLEELMNHCADMEDANAWTTIAALCFEDINLQDDTTYALLGPSRGSINSLVRHPPPG